MISDLQNLGEWLNEKDLVDFGKNVNADDYICTVSYQNGNFSLNSIKMTKDCNLNFYAKSLLDGDPVLSEIFVCGEISFNAPICSVYQAI